MNGLERIANPMVVSAQWARFWRIYTHAGESCVEDLMWAAEFFVRYDDEMRNLMETCLDRVETEKLELIRLGLYHTGYAMPYEYTRRDYSGN